MTGIDLGAWHSALVVIAHPDDESFGLGGVLERLTSTGVGVRVLCFTSGEASTLGDGADLAVVRPRELACAAAELQVDEVKLLDHPDGGLSSLAPAELERAVDEQLADADVVVVFERNGVTSHPDHQAATRAAEQVAARRGLAVLEWGVPTEIATALNDEFGTSFVGLDGEDLQVDRDAQRRAIACHRSQSDDNPVLHRRLELQGRYDRVRLRAVSELRSEAGPSPLPPGGIHRRFMKP
jgi:LmbE family N-acetylglucosaminyl deacetylase